MGVLHLCKEEPREPMSYTTGFLVKVSDQLNIGSVAGCSSICNAFSRESGVRRLGNFNKLR